VIKKLHLLLLCLCLVASSCTLVIKGLGRAVIRDYDKYKNLDLTNVHIIDTTGRQRIFAEVFAGKAVYLYVWKEQNKLAPNDKDKKYKALKQRFEKYPDVVFAELSLCTDCKNNSYSNRLVMDESSAELRSVLDLTDPAPFIIGKNGQMLAFKGPKPSDDLLVDYVLYQSRNGIDGTKSGKKLIRGVNSHSRFKTRHLREWYTKHFNQDPTSFDFNFSSTK
jgi:hypothetical protein